MSYSDDLVKLRKRMVDALELGVVDNSSKDLYEATLIQVMNEAERQRQACVARAEDFRRQAAVADGQSHAFTQVSSIVYNILNGYIMAAEKQKREEVERADEMAEKEAARLAAIDSSLQSSDSLSDEDSKKRKKK
jgi:hypothetical protein